MGFSRLHISDSDLFDKINLRDFTTFNSYMTGFDCYVCNGEFSGSIHELYYNSNTIVRECIWNILKSENASLETIKMLGKIWRSVYTKSDMLLGILSNFYILIEKSETKVQYDIILSEIIKTYEN